MRRAQAFTWAGLPNSRRSQRRRGRGSLIASLLCRMPLLGVIIIAGNVMRKYAAHHQGSRVCRFSRLDT